MVMGGMAMCRMFALRSAAAGLVLAAGAMLPAVAAQPLGEAALGAVPSPETTPRAEFVFEARVTLAPATVLGETGLGHRQYIPITGGTVSGPRFKGEVIPGGWDYQLRSGGGCNSLTADYFWRAEDGTVIHILNQGLMCPGAAPGERNYLTPRFEAPKGPHEWLTRATFVATLELERPASPPAQGTAPALGAIRIKFYQIK
jgi:hypothetical protein